MQGQVVRYKMNKKFAQDAQLQTDSRRSIKSDSSPDQKQMGKKQKEVSKNWGKTGSEHKAGSERQYQQKVEEKAEEPSNRQTKTKNRVEDPQISGVKVQIKSQSKPQGASHEERVFQDDQEEQRNYNMEHFGSSQNEYFKEQESQSQNKVQISAVYDQVQINQLATEENEMQARLNDGVIEQQANKVYEHMVENKHLLVLYLLYRKEIYDIFPKKKYNRVDIHPANRNKIKIFGNNDEEIKEVSLKISQIVNKISIVKLNIRKQEAIKMKSSKALSKRLLNDKMVIIHYGNSSQKSYYLGGKGSQPYLCSIFKQIRNLKFKYFMMFDYMNTRSYKIVLNYIIKQKQLVKAFQKWNIKSLQSVQYIPNSSVNRYKKDKQKNMCFLMTTIGHVDNFSPKQIENNMSAFIKNNFYSVVLIFKQGQHILPKFKVQGITFKYVSERKFNRSYLYMVCLKKDFFQKRQDIIKQVEKLQIKNKIYGARFFRHLSPQITQYIKPQQYKIMKYPQTHPYSYSVVSRRLEDSNQQKKPQTQEQRQNQGQIKENQGLIKEIKQSQQKKPMEFYSFDWRQHLRNLQSTEISFVQQINI